VGHQRDVNVCELIDGPALSIELFGLLARAAEWAVFRGRFY
jgi:hypothetical protein